MHSVNGASTVSTVLAVHAAARVGRKRILMVAARYFPLMGGIETHVYETAQRMAALGHSVDVLTTDLTGTLNREEMSEGVRIIRVPAWPRHSDIRFAPSVYAHIRRGSWDIIHIQGYHTLVAPLAMLAAIRSQIPFVVTFHSGGHSSKFRSALRGLQRAVLRPLLKRANQLIGVSELEADFFSSTMGLARDRFVVLPNGAGLPSVTVPASDSPTAGPMILAVGRLELYKGHQRAIAAMPYVLAKQPDAYLRIAGTGPDGARLRALVSSLGLKDKVTIGAINQLPRDLHVVPLKPDKLPRFASDSLLTASSKTLPWAYPYMDQLLGFRFEQPAVPFNLEARQKIPEFPCSAAGQRLVVS
jgi:glycosyltransferase involved in cell wall biosynthesis